MKTLSLVNEWPLNLYRKLHDNNTLTEFPKDFENRLGMCVLYGYLSDRVLSMILFKYKYGMSKYAIASMMGVTTSTIDYGLSYGIRRIISNAMSIIDDINKDPLDMTMRDLRLPVRLINILNRELGSYGSELTVRDLIKHSKSELLDTPNNGIGVVSINMINNRLSVYEMKLME